MTGEESRKLKAGDRVCWKGDAKNQGTVKSTSWSGVTIEWDDGDKYFCKSQRYGADHLWSQIVDQLNCPRLLIEPSRLCLSGRDRLQTRVRGKRWHSVRQATSSRSQSSESPYLKECRDEASREAAQSKKNRNIAFFLAEVMFSSHGAP